jgi:hypothetical protein
MAPVFMSITAILRLREPSATFASFALASNEMRVAPPKLSVLALFGGVGGGPERPPRAAAVRGFVGRR